MSKKEFMKELERLLSSVPKDERESALKYYEDYFEDAGLENEPDVLKQLGSPERIADMIKKDIYGKGNGGEYTESGYVNDQDKVAQCPVISHSGGYSRNSESGKNSGNWFKSSDNTSKVILIVILCIVFSPVIFGGGFGVIGTLIGLIIGVTAAAGGMLIGGVALLIFGIVNLFIYAPLGVMSIGGGMLIFGIGIFFMMLTVWLWGTALPALIHWIIDVFHNVFGKKEERA